MTAIATQKTVTVLARYFIKATGSICCLVKNGEGKQYCVTLNRNKQHTCTCAAYTKAHKTCYHVEHIREIENARAARENAARKAQAPITDISTKGNLHSNQGFSLLRTA